MHAYMHHHQLTHATLDADPGAGEENEKEEEEQQQQEKVLLLLHKEP
jgi:hypothetical protein